jgi:hypothetical protein
MGSLIPKNGSLTQARLARCDRDSLRPSPTRRAKKENIDDRDYSCEVI